MTLTDYYNYFMELAQYSRAGVVDMLSLISKFQTHLRHHTFEEMIALWFNSLVDCYVVALRVETNLDKRNVECTGACGHGDSDNCKITHRSEGRGWQGQGHQSGGSLSSCGSKGRGRFNPFDCF